MQNMETLLAWTTLVVVTRTGAIFGFRPEYNTGLHVMKPVLARVMLSKAN